MNEPERFKKIDPTEIVAIAIFILIWLVAGYILANTKQFGFSHGDSAYYFPVLVVFCSIFYIIYLAVHSFWRAGNRVFYRWLLAIAVSPLIIVIIIAIVTFS